MNVRSGFLVAILVVMMQESLHAQSGTESLAYAYTARREQGVQVANIANPVAPRSKKKKKGKNITDSYLAFGLGYTMGLGGDAPYKSGINAYVSDGIPILDQRVLLDFNLNVHFLFSPNEKWFSKAFMVPQSSISGLGMGYYDMLTVGVSPVLLNKKNSALTLGAFGGINLIMLPSMSDYIGSYSFSSPVAFCYGIKSAYYFDKNLFLFMQLSLNSLNRVAAELPSGYTSNTVPVSYSTISVGAAFKFDLWDW